RPPPSLAAVREVSRAKFRLLTLPERVERRPLPEVRIVDMREEFRLTGASSLLSRDMVEAIRETRAAGEQAMLLLNRRGFATFLLCRSCGDRLSCSGCRIALTYHRAEALLRAHYCGPARAVPTACPTCRSPHLHAGGAGTQRLEEAIRMIDPTLRVARMDRDTVRRHRHAEILERFQRREIDLLL